MHIGGASAEATFAIIEIIAPQVAEALVEALGQALLRNRRVEIHPLSTSPHVPIEIAELQNKTVNQVVQRYEQVFNEECRSRNKQYLIRRIAWRLQANDEGGLSRAALKKAAELAEDA